MTHKKSDERVPEEDEVDPQDELLSDEEYETVLRLLPKILRTPMPVSTLPGERTLCCERIHDDHDGTWSGTLIVGVLENGDMWIRTTGETHNVFHGTLRFREPMSGGGMSPATYAALRLLLLAMHQDSQEHPISRPSHAPEE